MISPEQIQEQAEKLYPYKDGMSKIYTDASRTIYIKHANHITQWMREREKWISVEDKLPPFTREYSGNKLTDLVLTWNGSEQFIMYLEAVRPDFTTLIWSFEYPFQDMPHDFDVELLEYKGEPITHWKNLSTPPIK